MVLKEIFHRQKTRHFDVDELMDQIEELSDDDWTYLLEWMNKEALHELEDTDYDSKPRSGDIFYKRHFLMGDSENGYY